MKLLSNQSLWIMRERETRAHTHAGWEDEKTTRLIILRPIFITVPSVISLTDSNSPQLCVRWQMKTNYGNCFVNLKADSLPSSRTYTDNPVGPRNYPLLTAHQHTCVPVRACVIPFVANPFVVKELWTCKCVCLKKKTCTLGCLIKNHFRLTTAVADFVWCTLIGYCFVNIFLAPKHIWCWSAWVSSSGQRRRINFKLLICLFIYCFLVVSL